jgi:hypothetical protein
VQHDLSALDGEPVVLRRDVSRDLILEYGAHRAGTPVVARHPVVRACEGLHPAVERRDIVGRISSLAVCLSDEAPDQRQYVSDAVIQFRDQ